MTDPVVILGAASFGGGELLRLLELHDGVRVTHAVSRSRSGLVWSTVHPNLGNRARSERFVNGVDWIALAKRERVVVFSALRSGELAAQYAALESSWREAGLQERVLLIDLSADFRLEGTGEFQYGLSEWMAEALRGASRIANPGCFATALALGLLPLARELDLESVSAFGFTGSSGAGLTPTERTHHPFRAHNFQPYQPFRHRHTQEVDHVLARCAHPIDWSFIPYSAPWVRGIHVTIEARLSQPLPDQELLAQIYQESYRQSSFVHWVEDPPALQSVVGGNHCLIGGAVRGRRLAVFVVLDNLVKGMAGQAIQNLNLARGWPEDRGLDRLAGPYPV